MPDPYDFSSLFCDFSNTTPQGNHTGDGWKWRVNPINGLTKKPMLLTFPTLTRLLPPYASHFSNPQSWSAESPEHGDELCYTRILPLKLKLQKTQRLFFKKSVFCPWASELCLSSVFVLVIVYYLQNRRIQDFSKVQKLVRVNPIVSWNWRAPPRSQHATSSFLVICNSLWRASRNNFKCLYLLAFLNRGSISSKAVSCHRTPRLWGGKEMGFGGMVIVSWLCMICM